MPVFSTSDFNSCLQSQTLHWASTAWEQFSIVCQSPASPSPTPAPEGLTLQQNIDESINYYSAEAARRRDANMNWWESSQRHHRGTVSKSRPQELRRIWLDEASKVAGSTGMLNTPTGTGVSKTGLSGGKSRGKRRLLERQPTIGTRRTAIRAKKRLYTSPESQ